MTRAPLWLACLTFALTGCPSPGPGEQAGQAPADPAAAGAGAASAALKDPSQATLTAPDEFVAKFETTQGVFRVQVHRAWAPHGADRFYNLIQAGYYTGCKFFRVINDPPFMAQFGINGDPAVNEVWIEATIPDDPVKESNTRGKVTFAMTGEPNSRTTQLFVNYRDNSNLDSMGFAPFGEVIEGMDVVDKLYGGYGEGAPRGPGPRQDLAQTQGNAYLEDSYPKLDGIVQVTVE